MRRITRNTISLAISCVLALASLAMSAPKSEQSNRSFTLTGRVLKVDYKDSTMLVKENSTKKLYLVIVPEGASFKIFFGRGMKLGYPNIEHVDRHNIIQVRCKRTGQERLARLEDGTQVVVLTAAN